MRLGEFRFYCQKVLPLVYDTSLSYYEVLCKVTDYLNKTMETVNDLSDEFDNLKASFDELKEYIDRQIADVYVYIDNKLSKYNDEYFDTLIEQKFLEMIDSGYFPVYKFINYLPEYGMSTKADNGIKLSMTLDSNYYWYGCCMVGNYLYIASIGKSANNTVIHKIDLSTKTIIKSSDLGENTYIKTMSYDKVNNIIMAVDDSNKYIYYLEPINLAITGALKYNRNTNDYSNIISFDLMSNKFGFSIPKGTNDILVYSYNGNSNIAKLIGYKNFDCIGNLKISDCTTSGNMLFILCTLASSGTKYNNNCIIAYSPSQGIFKKIILPKDNYNLTGISSYYKDGVFTGIYLNNINGEVYAFNCNDDILKKDTPTSYAITSGFEELFSFSNDEYGYIEDSVSTQLDNIDRVLKFPLHFYVPYTSYDILNKSYDRIKIGTAVIGSDIGDIYMHTSIATPSVIYNIKGTYYNLKIRYNIDNGGYATFTHYDFKDYNNNINLSGDLEHFKNNCADYLIPYIDVRSIVDNVYNYTIGMSSIDVRYKNSCLYQTLGYKGTPYNTIGCIPLAYPNDDRNVSITVTANPANIGTTFNVSSSSQSVGVFSLSGATIYEVIGQTMSDGNNTYTDMLTYTIDDSIVSVSAIVERAGVYSGGLTVRGITGNVYDDIFVPVTINAVDPTPISIFSKVSNQLNLKTLKSSSNYFTSNVTVSDIDGYTLNITESSTYHTGSYNSGSYLAVPANNGEVDVLACFEFTPEFLQGKETITIYTLDTSNSGSMPFIMRGDDLNNIENTKRKGGKYYGYEGNSNWHPVSNEMPVDSNNKYYICIAKTGSTLGYLANARLLFA